MKTTVDPTPVPLSAGAVAATATSDAGFDERLAALSVAPRPAHAPQVEGYAISRMLGEGGMGTVWRATQLSTRRDVALKLLGLRLFASERTRQRFDREVELTAKLEHPNIARIYDSGVDHGVYYYAMELIDGVELDRYVKDNHLSRIATLELMRTVCEAVQHAHERGIIHRDLKPSNIMVTADGQPHVLDFGLAKAVEGTTTAGAAVLSMEGEVAGTPAYMSPEQAMGKIDQIDTRSDVYSLGVILYCLLVGKPPHDLSGSSYEVIRRIHDEDPVRPRQVTRTVDRDLETLLLKALAREPKDRYASAGELARDLTNYLNHDPLIAKAPTMTYFLRKRLRKHRLPIGIAAGTLGSLLVGGSVWAGLAYNKIVTIPVNTDPPGATVYVDGVENSCGTPCYAFVGPGTHTITVKHPGSYLPATRVVEVAWGKAKFSTAEPIAMTPNYQVLTFSSLPVGATFELFERETGRLAMRGVTPMETRVPVGKYRATFTLAGYVDDRAIVPIDVAGSTAARVVNRELRPAGAPQPE